MDTLIDYKNDIFKIPAQKFDFKNPQTDAVSLYNTLGKLMIERKGVALSAPQIGLNLKVFVIHTDPILGFFNPIIVDKSEEYLDMEEGCLTFPELTVKIKRPRVIKVRFADALGVVQTTTFQDLTARLIQHEMDHLDGVLFTQRIGEVKLMTSLNKAKKRGKDYIMRYVK